MNGGSLATFLRYPATPFPHAEALWRAPRDDSYLAVPLSWGPEAR